MSGEQVRFECACRWRCGFKVMIEGRFVAGHSPASPEPPRMCGCGCGKPTSSALIAFRAGHRPAAARRPARQPVPATMAVATQVPGVTMVISSQEVPGVIVPGSLMARMLEARLGSRC